MNKYISLHYKIKTIFNINQIYLFKTTLMAIIDYWTELTKKQRTELRNRILAETGISYPSFYAKLKKSSFTLCEEKVITKIITDYVGAN